MIAFLMSMIQDIKRNFRTILDLGSGPGHFSKLLEAGKVQKSIMLDSSGNFSCFHLSVLISCAIQNTFSVGIQIQNLKVSISRDVGLDVLIVS